MELVTWITITRYAAAGICMGLGAIGPAAGIGYAACKGAQAISRQPSAMGGIMRMLRISRAITRFPRMRKREREYAAMVPNRTVKIVATLAIRMLFLRNTRMFHSYRTVR